MEWGVAVSKTRIDWNNSLEAGATRPQIPRRKLCINSVCNREGF